jgi:hypothetical protein
MQQLTPCSCIPSREIASLANLFESLLAPIDCARSRRTFLTSVSDVVLRDSTMTGVRLEFLYRALGVAEGDIPSQAILELMNLPLGSHPLAVAYIRDHHISLVTIDVRGDDELAEFLDFFFASGHSPPGVNHPGVLSPGGVDANIAADVHRELVQGLPLHPADNVARMPPGAGDAGKIGSLILAPEEAFDWQVPSEVGATVVSACDTSQGSQGKKRKTR